MGKYKKALISVWSKQQDDNDAVEVVTPGKFYKEDCTYYAEYDETEISGMEGTTTTLQINQDELMLIREGTTSAKMEFKNDEQCISLYNTPYGMLELSIQTKNLKTAIDDCGGEIYIDYNIGVTGQKPQATQLKIKINVNEE